MLVHYLVVILLFLIISLLSGNNEPLSLVTTFSDDTDILSTQLMISYVSRSAMPLQYRPEAQVCQCPPLIGEKWLFIYRLFLKILHYLVTMTTCGSSLQGPRRRGGAGGEPDCL